MPFNIVAVLLFALSIRFVSSPAPGCPCLPTWARHSTACSRRVALNTHFILSIIWWIHTNSEKKNGKAISHVRMYTWWSHGQKKGDTFSPKNTKLFDHHYTNRFFLFIFIIFFCSGLCYLVAATALFLIVTLQFLRYISICVFYLFFFSSLSCLGRLFSAFFFCPPSSDFLWVFARVLARCVRFIHAMCKCLWLCVCSVWLFGILPLYLNIMAANNGSEMNKY